MRLASTRNAGAIGTATGGHAHGAWGYAIVVQMRQDAPRRCVTAPAFLGPIPAALERPKRFEARSAFGHVACGTMWVLVEQARICQHEQPGLRWKLVTRAVVKAVVWFEAEPLCCTE